MQAINRHKVPALIRASNGTIFSVDFVKVNGEERTMVCRTGVRKNLKGGTNPAQGPQHPYLTVWDMQKQGYRMVNPATARRVRMAGEVFEVVDGTPTEVNINDQRAMFPRA
jgi:hypothetical protein